MNDGGIHGLASLALSALWSSAWYVGYLLWWTPERRRDDAWKWSLRHLAAYDERWRGLLELQLRSRVRADFAWVFVFSFLLLSAPTSAKAFAACLVAAPGVLASLKGLAFSRVPLPPGT